MGQKTVYAIIASLCILLPTQSNAQIEPSAATSTVATGVEVSTTTASTTADVLVTEEILETPRSPIELTDELISYLQATSTRVALSDDLEAKLLERAIKTRDTLILAETVLESDNSQKERNAATLRRFARVELDLIKLLTETETADSEAKAVLTEINVHVSNIVEQVQEPKVKEKSGFVEWLSSFF